MTGSMRSLAIAVVVVVATIPSLAHIVPVPPSVCAFDPLTLEVPAAGVAGSASGAVTADALRSVYDTQDNTVTFCPADPNDPTHACAAAAVPRAFTIGPLSGSLTFPTTFTASAAAGGDFRIDNLPIQFQVNATSVSASATLTTGLTTASGLLMEGARIGAFGRYTLVGIVTPSGLPAPLDHPVELTLTCQATPAPDVDQFSLLPSVSRASGTITAKRVHLKLTIDLPPGQTADFTTHPALLRLHTADIGIAAVALPTGLTGSGHRFSGKTQDGTGSIKVRVRTPQRYVLTFDVTGAKMPLTTGHQALVEITQNVGGFLSRGEKLMHANKSGTKLHAS